MLGRKGFYSKKENVVVRGMYRFIYFIPDHFNGSRHAIGAIVAEGGRIRVVKAEMTPCEACIGSAAGYMLLKQSLKGLGEIRSFDELPMSFGPHFDLSEPRILEREVGDPLVWLREEVLPTQEGLSRNKATQPVMALSEETRGL